MKALMAILIGLCLIGCNVAESDNRVLLKHEGYFYYLEESPNTLFMQGMWWDRERWAWIRTQDTLIVEGNRDSDWWKSGKFNRGITGNEPWYSRDGGKCWHTWTSSEEGFPCIPGRLVKGK